MADDIWRPAVPSVFDASTADATDPHLAAGQPFGLTLVMIRRGRRQSVVEACERLFDIRPPLKPLATAAKDIALIWSGPDQFLVLGNADTWPAIRSSMQEIFAGHASLSDQESGRMLISLRGRNVRAALCKLISIDLHEDSFAEGAAASTALEHVAVNLWRDTDDDDGAPVFHMLVPTTYAASLGHAIQQACAEFREPNPYREG